MSDATDLGLVLDQVSKDKNIERPILVDALEQAILMAGKRAFGEDRELEAKFNDVTGQVDLFQIIVVADPVNEAAKEISIQEADQFKLNADVGDELLFQIFYHEKDQPRAEEQDGKYGELLKLNRAWKTFGRIAAQTAKQVILQRVREAERDNVFNQYKDKRGELVSGIVRRFERGSIVIDLSGTEAVLPIREQVPRESYRAGDRIVTYLVDIDKAARGPQLIVSRGHRGLLEKLFEMEVPEIYEQIVRIEASAREPGARSKIAVSSRDKDVDAVGACVGMKGSRVQAVVQELRGEKIDIVPFDSDPARFVCNAIAPAQVTKVLIDAGSHTMELVVPDDKLSLAIGKKGQNVRLASQLTGWRIDIHSETKMREAEARARASLGAIEGVGSDGAEALFRDGWGSAAQIAGASIAELSSVLGSEEKARKVQVAARAAAEVEATQARALAASRRIEEEAAAIATEVALAAAAEAAQPGEADQA
ncbi:MAG: transcription termination factor NusA [Deltaproteobacteria bacterium]|nr:transcription termination factor NusA [Deltaproteobacteria bacterium]